MRRSTITGIMIVAVIAVVAIAVVGWFAKSPLTPAAQVGLANVAITEHHFVETDAGLFGLTPAKYTASGTLTNSGWVTSGPVVVQLRVYDGGSSSAPLLYTTTTTVDPIRPGDTGYYLFKITSDDLSKIPDSSYAAVTVLSY